MQIQRCEDTRGRKSMASENLINLGSVCARPFRPRDLAAGVINFTPQQSDDIVQFEDPHRPLWSPPL